VNERSSQSVSSLRLSVVALVLVCAVGVLLWRAVDLSVFRKDFLQEQGDARAMRVVSVPAHRGMITDRNGEPLAISTPVDSVWVNPQEFHASRGQWVKLTKLLGLDLQRTRNLVASRRDKSFVYLKRQIDPDLAKRVMALGLAGLSLQREYRRYYPTGPVTAHVIGFTNVDDVGQEGLELAYNHWLRGTPGAKRVIKDRLGHIVQNVESIREPRPGKTLHLSIDRRVQYLAYRELKRAVMQNKARSGSAVVLDARTGEVLAMVNQPSYNPNNREDLKGSRYRNRAVTDVFEPGSTIKPFTIAAALDDGHIKPSTTIDTSPGYYRVSGNLIRDDGNYGRIDITTIIKKSSNVGASKISLSIPPRDLWKTLTDVGFGMTTGSGFPGESGGLLNPYQSWQRIERATLAFGYGLSVTTLQLAHAYTALADDGCLPPISFVRQDTPRSSCHRVLPARTTREVRHMLEAVVTKGGTGTRAAIPGYQVAGKTGTVKKVGANGYSDRLYDAIFAGMAPASNPRLVMVVCIKEPRAGKFYGGLVAAPVFEKVMAGALRLLDVPPDNLPASTIKVAALEGRP